MTNERWPPQDFSNKETTRKEGRETVWHVRSEYRRDTAPDTS